MRLLSGSLVLALENSSAKALEPTCNQAATANELGKQLVAAADLQARG